MKFWKKINEYIEDNIFYILPVIGAIFIMVMAGVLINYFNKPSEDRHKEWSKSEIIELIKEHK